MTIQDFVSDYIPQLNAETWVGVSAYIALGSAAFTLLQAIIAFFGLWFVGRQIRDARRASDVQNLFAFYKSITDAEQALANAEEGEAKEQAFYELANLLEMQAMALRGGIYTGITREAVELKLVDSCALIQLSPYWWNRLNDGRSTEAAFKDLFLFIKKKHRTLARVKRLLQSPVNPEASNTTSAQQTAICDLPQEAPSADQAPSVKGPVTP